MDNENKAPVSGGRIGLGGQRLEYTGQVAALRARIAELEAEAERCTYARHPKAIADMNNRIAELEKINEAQAEQLGQAYDRCADLSAENKRLRKTSGEG